MRSRCGASAVPARGLANRSRAALGHRSAGMTTGLRGARSVDSRQATTGNTRRAGSQETRELELSQRRMRSGECRGGAPKGERLAIRAAAAQRSDGNVRSRDADMDGAPIGAPPPFFVRMTVSENRTPLFGIMRGRRYSCCAWWFAKLGCEDASRERFCLSRHRGQRRRQTQSPLIPAKAGIQAGSPPSRGRA
jgi:hypothetical protein